MKADAGKKTKIQHTAVRRGRKEDHHENTATAPLNGAERSNTSDASSTITAFCDAPMTPGSA
jgi:hypothetical protein